MLTVCAFCQHWTPPTYIVSGRGVCDDLLTPLRAGCKPGEILTTTANECCDRYTDRTIVTPPPPTEEKGGENE